MKTRVDLATAIHKAIRKILFDQARDLARADHRSAEECRRSSEATVHALELLREHGEHEDAVIFPAIGATEPELAAEAARQHAVLESRMRDLERMARALVLVTPSERHDTGRRLTVAFELFVADQLRHLAFEEAEICAALWRAFDDGELLAMQARILARVPPARAPEWRDLLLASVNPTERAALEAATESAAPAA